MREPAFGGESGLTAAASGGDALTPLSIGDITCCEHTFHGGLRSTRLGDQVTDGIAVELVANELCVGRVSDGIKHAPNSQLLVETAVTSMQVEAA